MDQIGMKYSSAIDKRGRITVPREVRLRLGLTAGDRVEFVVEDELIVLRPARLATNVFDKYKGVFGTFAGVVADHVRSFKRDQVIYEPWHYIPVLLKKPGALRNGAPFKGWDLPPALAQVRQQLQHHADADRQFVKVLAGVLDHGLAAVESACSEALAAGIANADVILTILARQCQPPPVPSITTPHALQLKTELSADCGRYDSIRKVA